MVLAAVYTYKTLFNNSQVTWISALKSKVFLKKGDYTNVAICLGYLSYHN